MVVQPPSCSDRTTDAGRQCIGGSMAFLKTMIIATAAGFGLHAGVDRLAAYPGASILTTKFHDARSVAATVSVVADSVAASSGYDETEQCAGTTTGISVASRTGQALFQRTLHSAATASVVDDDPISEPERPIASASKDVPLIYHVRRDNEASGEVGQVVGTTVAPSLPPEEESPASTLEPSPSSEQVSNSAVRSRERPTVNQRNEKKMPAIPSTEPFVVDQINKDESLSKVVIVPIPVIKKTRKARKAIAGVLNNTLLGDPLVPIENGETEEPSVAAALVFPAVALMLGCFLLYIIERWCPLVPYTFALFFSGCLFQAVHFVKMPGKGLFRFDAVYEATEIWSNISPHLLLFAFLPPLLFSEAMRLNVDLAGRMFWQVFLLAVPGVLIGCSLNGVVIKQVLPYGWDWPICFVMGAILSATDPVAVVALFKSLGVSPRLTMLISGESILNDGTSIVLFSLTLKVIMGAKVTMTSVSVFFLHMTILSVIFGFVVGCIALWIIGQVAVFPSSTASMIQTITTIACAYLSFFIAESELGTSGVLATVTSGVVLARSAWPRFASRETMETVWESIEFVGNTVIFFLAGDIFMKIILSRSQHIGVEDLVWNLILFAGITLVRAIVIVVLWLPLNYVGEPFTISEGLVVVWSGLRGAVSLAMCIVVDTKSATSERMGSKVMFHVGGIAALTFLVNATTCSKLISVLNLAGTSSMRKKVLRCIVDGVYARAETISSEEDDPAFRGANKGVLAAMVPSLQEKNERSDMSADNFPVGIEDPLTVAEAALVDYRLAFLRFVGHKYMLAIDEGIIPRLHSASVFLPASIEKAQARAAVGLTDWDEFAQSIAIKKHFFREVAQHMADMRPFRYLPFLHAFKHEQVKHEKVLGTLCFQDAHRRAREELPMYFGNSSLIDVGIQDRVANESKQNCQESDRVLDSMPAEVIEFVTSEMLARKLLWKRINTVNELMQQDVLSSSEKDHLVHQSRHAGEKLYLWSKCNWYMSLRGSRGGSSHVLSTASASSAESHG
eukprot:TRINITY_DN48942_c0_g1_i1.p1 TRINITY_DN48942_c0_g1~~TRINITY_DN48942_c0_g1_i1.p1  ORF type:complete len:1019 (+),score=174.71 TRINITY_DN48942_c0_g1_i1:60-3116(+)